MTVFIIAGMLFLVILTSMYYLSTKTEKAKLESSAREADILALKTRSLSSYVTQCLEATSQEAVLKIAKQGGVFFSNQDGSIIHSDVESAPYEDYAVAYQIRTPSFMSTPPE
ncbi:MAG TPA: hypothetical protein VI894_01475, partial [Candidatus Nanoarchaeia archaeon]|nr:hypothetical protein [Candidatus Nanoarchaeia archaeon]